MSTEKSPPRRRTVHKDYEPRTDFQRWVKPQLDSRRWSYRDLAHQLHALGVDVTENFVWRVTRGDPDRYPNAQRPGYEIAFGVGKVFGDPVGAVRAAGYSYAPDPLGQTLLPLDPTPFRAALSGLFEVSAGPERELSGERADALTAPDLQPMLVRGECMAPVVRDGDILFVRPAESVRDGDLVVALVDNIAPTCKRICIPEEGASYLEPLNGEGRIRENRFVVQGVVTHVVEDVRRRLLRLEAA